MPNSKEKISNPFSDGYRPGWNPQVNCGDEAGYLGIRKILIEDRIRREAEKQARAHRRKLRMARKRNNRYYARKKARLAANGVGKHPALSTAESRAVAEAASLA